MSIYSGQSNYLQNQQGPKTREDFLRERTAADFDSGISKGEELITNHPDMQMIRGRLEDLSKGYSGSEMGALRGQAQSELAGQRSQYLRQLASKAGRGGIGGARAAAMQGAADQGFSKSKAEMERKMALDNAQLMRGGTKDYADYLMRQRFAVLGTGAGMAQLNQAAYTQAAQEAAAERAAAAAGQKSSGGGIGGNIGKDQVATAGFIADPSRYLTTNIGKNLLRVDEDSDLSRSDAGRFFGI